MGVSSADPPDNPQIAVSVIVSEKELDWSPVRFFLDGLSGALRKGTVYVDRETVGGNGSRSLSALVFLERSILPWGKATGQRADVLPLPPQAEDLAPCDVIVDFRPGPAAAEICRRARYGLWSFSCQDHAAIFAALARGESALECRLYRQTGDDGARRTIATARVQGKHALAPTLTFAGEKSVQLALRELRRLALLRKGAEGEWAQHVTITPRLAGLAQYGLRMARLATARAIERMRPSGSPGAPFGLRTGAGSLADIDPATGVDLPRPDRTFCADPFLIEKDGAVYCFYEEFPFDTGIGKIAVALLSDDGATRLGDALTADHHLSFPFVFEHGGDTFMLPETINARRLEIWRCTQFPLQWELHTVAFEGQQLADPLLFRQGEDWWLFANASHDTFGDFSSELNLYKVDGPDLRRIEPHPLNPVVIGSDVARGGGRVFEADGRLYRYSQDNSGNIYGHGLNLMEITELSDTGYAEHRVAHFTPDRIPGALGCHHADAVAGRFIVDVRLP